MSIDRWLWCAELHATFLCFSRRHDTSRRYGEKVSLYLTSVRIPTVWYRNDEQPSSSRTPLSRLCDLIKHVASTWSMPRTSSLNWRHFSGVAVSFRPRNEWHAQAGPQGAARPPVDLLLSLSPLSASTPRIFLAEDGSSCSRSALRPCGLWFSTLGFGTIVKSVRTCGRPA
jgi:hypothetical protein